jgi:hypothetical protein
LSGIEGPIIATLALEPEEHLHCPIIRNLQLWYFKIMPECVVYSSKGLIAFYMMLIYEHYLRFKSGLMREPPK